MFVSVGYFCGVNERPGYHDEFSRRFRPVTGSFRIILLEPPGHVRLEPRCAERCLAAAIQSVERPYWKYTYSVGQKIGTGPNQLFDHINTCKIAFRKIGAVFPGIFVKVSTIILMNSKPGILGTVDLECGIATKISLDSDRLTSAKSKLNR